MNQSCSLISLVALTALASPARAHRLDEYLQATRIDLSSNRVEVEIDLTPGVQVADAVLTLIDVNRDGAISKAEGEAYARGFLKSVVMQVDQQGHDLKLGRFHYPSVGEIKLGTGVIHFQASVEFDPLAAGPHQLFFQNQHQSTLSVYLINAYIPRSPAIQIKHQARDVRQTEIRIDYDFMVQKNLPSP